MIAEVGNLEARVEYLLHRLRLSDAMGRAPRDLVSREPRLMEAEIENMQLKDHIQQQQFAVARLQALVAPSPVSAMVCTNPRLQEHHHHQIMI